VEDALDGAQPIVDEAFGRLDQNMIHASLAISG
jgi:hypothetical protein